MLLAAAAGRVRLAAKVEETIASGTDEAFGRLQRRVGHALRRRIAYVTGRSTFDLPLHNGLVYGEARLIGRLALSYATKQTFRSEMAERLLYVAARERGLLLSVLLALITRLGETEQRVVKREIRRLRLPREISRSVMEALDFPPSTESLARTIAAKPLRRFVLEQVYLASLLGGGVDEEKRCFLEELAHSFGFTTTEMQAVEAELADAFSDPDDVLDAFEIRAAGQATSEAMVDKIARELLLNADRIVHEVKETGELTQLLLKAARGQKLPSEERAKAREQLIDLAKVVPSIAIIAAPGGMLIFAALVKLLPSILPSSFHAKNEPQPPRPPRIAGRR
jgi:hypothetical protein